MKGTVVSPNRRTDKRQTRPPGQLLAAPTDNRYPDHQPDRPTDGPAVIQTPGPTAKNAQAEKKAHTEKTGANGEKRRKRRRKAKTKKKGATGEKPKTQKKP